MFNRDTRYNKRGLANTPLKRQGHVANDYLVDVGASNSHNMMIHNPVTHAYADPHHSSSRYQLPDILTHLDSDASSIILTATTTDVDNNLLDTNRVLATPTDRKRSYPLQTEFPATTPRTPQQPVVVAAPKKKPEIPSLLISSAKAIRETPEITAPRMSTSSTDPSHQYETDRRKSSSVRHVRSQSVEKTLAAPSSTSSKASSSQQSSAAPPSPNAFNIIKLDYTVPPSSLAGVSGVLSRASKGNAASSYKRQHSTEIGGRNGNSRCLRSPLDFAFQSPGFMEPSELEQELPLELPVVASNHGSEVTIGVSGSNLCNSGFDEGGGGSHLHLVTASDDVSGPPVSGADSSSYNSPHAMMTSITRLASKTESFFRRSGGVQEISSPTSLVRRTESEDSSRLQESSVDYGDQEDSRSKNGGSSNLKERLGIHKLVSKTRARDTIQKDSPSTRPSTPTAAPGGHSASLSYTEVITTSIHRIGGVTPPGRMSVTNVQSDTQRTLNGVGSPKPTTSTTSAGGTGSSSPNTPILNTNFSVSKMLRIEKNREQQLEQWHPMGGHTYDTHHQAETDRSITDAVVRPSSMRRSGRDTANVGRRKLRSSSSHSSSSRRNVTSDPLHCSSPGGYGTGTSPFGTVMAANTPTALSSLRRKLFTPAGLPSSRSQPKRDVEEVSVSAARHHAEGGGATETHLSDRLLEERKTTTKCKDLHLSGNNMGQAAACCGGREDSSKSKDDQWAFLSAGKKQSDLELFDKAYANEDIPAFLNLIKSTQPFHKKDDQMHPWAANPASVGALASTQIAVLAAMENPEMKERIRKCGAIPILVEQLKSPQDDRVHAAIVALSFLSVDSPRACVDMREAGIIPPLVELMKAPIEGLRAASAQTARNVYVLDVQYRKEFKNCGGGAALVQLLELPDKAYDPEQLYTQLEAIYHIEDYILDSSEEIPEFVMDIKAAGGTRALERLRNIPNPDISESAHSLYLRLAD